jgi:hypothetical protein
MIGNITQKEIPEIKSPSRFHVAFHYHAWRNNYTIVDGKCQDPVGKPRGTWFDNIQIILFRWIQLA